MNAKRKKNRSKTETDKVNIIKEDSEQNISSNDQEAEVDSIDSPEEEVEIKLETAEKEAKESYDRFLRVSAEFENYKKRTAREMNEFRKYANESLLRELLPVVDNLQRAIDSSINNKMDSGLVAEGIDMTLKEILKVLEKFAVKPIDALEKPFDPTFHEAVMQEETDEKPENTVLREFQKGYIIHDRLLRPTTVVVSKAKKNQDDDTDEETDLNNNGKDNN
jgi:molecular chaperone GrpE